MNHKNNLLAAIDTAKENLENVSDSIRWMSEAQPNKINAIFLATAVNDDDEGDGITINGKAVGDAPSLVAALVGSMEAQPELEQVFKTALYEFNNKPCNCPACKASRDENIKNQN